MIERKLVKLLASWCRELSSEERAIRADGATCDSENREVSSVVIDLNAIIRFNPMRKRNDPFTTIEFQGGYVMVLAMKFDEFFQLMKQNGFEILEP